MTIAEYVTTHTDRGECKCGRCRDVGNKPDPEGHTADMIFFKVARLNNGESLEEFKRLTVEHVSDFVSLDPLDGNEHNYMQLGAWIGDQGIALRYMGLGTLLGAFVLLTPKTMLHLDDDPNNNDLIMRMAGQGLVAVAAVKKEATANDRTNQI